MIRKNEIPQVFEGECAMAISKRFFIRKTSVLTALFIAYAISSVINPEGMGNVLSPLSAFAAGGILLFSYLRSDRSVKISLTLLLYALACLVWGIADVIWAAMSFSGKDPENSALLWIVYVLTNGFLMASIILFAVEQFQKWDLVQFVIDLIISGFLTGALFWVLFLKKDLSVLRALLASDLTSLASILADIVICISIFSWFLSIRAGRIPGFIRVLSAGLLLFSFADLYYYYIAYNGLYLANSLVDVAYIASMNLLAFGALWKTYKDGSVFDLSVTLNTGSRMRWIYLILYPFFAVLFSVTGIVDIQMTLTDFVTFALPIFLYWGSCKYVQLSLEKEALLRNQNKLLEQRVAEQIRELEFLANQDTLTTLFNRRYFMSCLSDTIETLRSTDLMAVLLMDLDRFKTINDMYGHDVGDRVLIELSHRLIAWNNCGATIARLGGDEFSILLAGKYTQKDIEDFCVELIDLCSKPIGVGDLSLPMTMSVGIALASSEEIDGKTLMTQADLSMYSAKAQGYNKYQIFNPLIHQDFKNNVEIEALLRQADCEKDFTLYYQPQYSLPDLKLVGAEALLRWETETLGFIPPGVFIPIAEETEHIFNIENGS
jgi:diguanylate cyclase (GGDEF)-like protein